MPLPVRQLQLKHLDGQEGVFIQPYISAAGIIDEAQINPLRSTSITGDGVDAGETPI